VAGSSDDIVASLDSLLFLFHSLVSGGPWWQEAKTNHPLLLVEALYYGSMVSQNECTGLLAPRSMGCLASMW
jgi:hypothetical protein